MNKKLFVFVGLLALGIGAVSTVALQSHAQQAPVYPATTAPTVVPIPATQGSTALDTDNIQDPSGVEKPDATSTAVGQVGTHDQSESDVANPNEIEDGN